MPRSHQQGASAIREHGVAALAAAIPVPPILEAGGCTDAPLLDVDVSSLPDVMLGAAASDLPAPEAIKTIRQPVLIRPWTDDPAHPLATSERLHELLPDSMLETQRMPDDLRALGSRLAEFFGHRSPVTGHRSPVTGH